MYIKKELFSYFEQLYKTLDKAQQKNFLELLRKNAGKNLGVPAKNLDKIKIEVVDNSFFDTHGAEASEFITKTLIKKTYREVTGKE